MLHETSDVGAHGAAPVTKIVAGCEPFTETTPIPLDLNDEWWVEVLRLRTVLSGIGREVIVCMARSIGRDEAAAADRFREDNSTLRLLHYPPLLGPAGRADPAWVRGDRHEDSGAITLVWQDSPGLEIWDRNGEWVAAPTRAWTLLVGVSIAAMTGGALSAATHRVAGALGTRRSVAYFFEPRLTASILPWPAPDAGHADPAGDDRYGEWLRRRHGIEAVTGHATLTST